MSLERNRDRDRDRLGVFLDLSQRRVMVVGGGSVGERRIERLLEVGAVVTLVSPRVTDGLAELAERGEISWLARGYQSSDLLPGLSSRDRSGDDAGIHEGHEGRKDRQDRQEQVDHPGQRTQTARFWLVHTATGTSVDSEVARDADEAGVWCIRADSAVQSTAILGATTTGADNIRVSVTSGDPRRSRDIAKAVGHSLATGKLPLRRRRRPSGLGWVALVGGGPGEVGLLTLRGRQLLAMADVVVADRLGPVGVLEELDEDVRIMDVGKKPGHHPVPQDEINEILVREAAAGYRVVRLKGGDPFVLGRGAEEAQYCQEHDVPVEWVPGVTSAVSVPAAAGIPVTHRATSPAFIVASGHEASRTAALTPPETTVLLLMGVLHLKETAELLMTEGRGADTPVAIVERGWTPAQRTTRADLGTCADVVAERGIRPPAIIVVGPAAALSDILGPVTPVVPR